MAYSTADLRREQRKGAVVVARGEALTYMPRGKGDREPWRAEHSGSRYRASECQLKHPTNGGGWIPCLRDLLQF